MRSSTIFSLAIALTTSHVAAQPGAPVLDAVAGSLGLGAACSAKIQCANGADCYGTTAFTIKTCGSFNGACTSDSQCATNTCQEGTCKGFLASSAQPTPTPPFICNAAAQARGACTATNAIVPTPTATSDPCAQACTAAYNTCRTNSANIRATCASEYSTCLGYSPFDSDGSLITPSACIIGGNGPSATLVICNAAAQARGACTATAASTPTEPATPVATDACVAACDKEYSTCRVGTPGASGNQASCAASYSKCLGFVPFDNGKFVQPTACVAPTATGAPTGSGAPAVTPTAGPDACAARCATQYDACRSDTSIPRASCAAKYAACLGYSPYDASGSLVTPTACRGAVPAPTGTGGYVGPVPTATKSYAPAVFTGAADRVKTGLGALMAAAIAAAL